jgi:hypothetical protein
VLKIEHRPMLVWDKSFDEIEERPKVKLASATQGLSCDTCYLKDSCPEYKFMSKCAIDWSSDIDTNNPKSMIDHLIKMQNERIQIARAAELADGGIPEQNLSYEMDRLSGLVATKNDMMMDKFSINIQGQQQNNSGGPGILASLFGKGASTLPQHEQKSLEEPITPTIDITKIPTFREEVVVEKKVGPRQFTGGKSKQNKKDTDE